MDQVNLTVCCRYAESLLANPRINRYLAKYHSTYLRELQMLLEGFESLSEVTGRAKS
jgi:hypothetical protein